MTPTTLALVADRREWLVMHVECARVQPAYGQYWYAADVTNAVGDLLGDRCAWCQFRLREPADPEIDQQRELAS